MAAIRRAIGVLFKPRYLLWTNIGSCGLLMALGDATVQGVERAMGQSKAPYDWARTARLGAVGVVLGPFNHYWFSFLDRALPGVKLLTVGKKILADQTVASPFFAVTFFMGTGLLEGQTTEESWKELKKKFWTVYKADWTLWPAAQAINFTFVPPRYRVLYVCGVTLVWNTILSYIKHRDHKAAGAGKGFGFYGQGNSFSGHSNSCSEQGNSCSRHGNSCSGHNNSCTGPGNSCSWHGNSCTGHDNSCTENGNNCSENGNSCSGHGNSRSMHGNYQSGQGNSGLLYTNFCSAQN